MNYGVGTQVLNYKSSKYRVKRKIMIFFLKYTVMECNNIQWTISTSNAPSQRILTLSKAKVALVKWKASVPHLVEGEGVNTLLEEVQRVHKVTLFVFYYNVRKIWKINDPKKVYNFFSCILWGFEIFENVRGIE